MNKELSNYETVYNLYRSHFVGRKFKVTEEIGAYFVHFYYYYRELNNDPKELLMGTSILFKWIGLYTYYYLRTALIIRA